MIASTQSIAKSGNERICKNRAFTIKNSRNKAKQKNLVIVRAGDNSLHTLWLNDRAQSNFDIFVSYFGDVPGKYKEGAEYYEQSKGLKWPILSRLLREYPEVFEAYEAYWFADDDLLTDAKTVSAMFDLFHEYDLWLAQPALGNGSYLTYPDTAQSADLILRFVGFIEIMGPIFNRNILSTLGFTFSMSGSGWGLDFLWPHLLNNPHNRIAILDKTPVIHTRPIFSGAYYEQCRRMGIKPQEDLEKILKANGITWSQSIPIYKRVAV